MVRVLFRIVFGGGDGPTVLFRLPEIPLPDVAAGIRLLGPVTREAVLAGLYDGLRLATLVICIGAANALANPKRLLRSLPPALYEIGTALVVATTVLPQFADSARRVRAAQGLRGGPAGRFAGLRRVVVPVLEDALERSLRLAAGMDARGYGRSGSATAGARAVTGALMLAALCGICVGVYAVLDTTAPRLLAVPMLAAGVALASAGLVERRPSGAPYPLSPGPVALAGAGGGLLRGHHRRSRLVAGWPRPARRLPRGRPWSRAQPGGAARRRHRPGRCRLRAAGPDSAAA